ncbi:chromosome segregation protein SMC, partial [Streptomyces sp.]|uniref:chromosome segregation protein SMC n=1 Tax=Streptomyces sp. TaxID=1931 RepID=UPI00281140D8
PIDYAEVTITRIMFRGGSSEYQINGDTCRLLDIQDLLSDSGIGREMHVIVGQGQLDSVLHADPMGRRAFIEEAAGVLKHRKRKEKALRKLDAMQANLARVQDLTDELRRRLKPLGRQAAVARRAAVIQADLRDARLRLLADDLVRLREALRAELADEAALLARKEATAAELREALAREADLEAEVRALAPRLERAEQSWYALSQLAERVRGTVSLADARVRSATAPPEDERRGRDPEDLEREAARVRAQEAELTAALEAAERALEDAVAHRAGLERDLAAEERRLGDLVRAVADRREGLARLQGQAGAARSRAAAAQAEIDRLTTARDEAAERAVTAQEEYERLRAEMKGLEADDTEHTERYEEARRELAGAEAALSAAREDSGEAERRRAATRARHDTLALGLRRKDGTEALLSAGLSGLLGPAAALLTVTPGYEIPVAAALGAAADALAADGTASAAEAIRLLRKQDAGRATLLLASPSERPAPADESGAPALPGHAVPAVRLVTGPDDLLGALRRLLDRTVVVGSLDEAVDIVRTHPALTAVTAEGDLLGAHYAQGGSAAAPSLLEVRAAVDEAAAELAELTARCEESAAAVRAAEERRRAATALVEELDARRRTAEREKSSVAQALGRLAGQARAAAGEAERTAAAVTRAQEALDRATAEAEELAERLLVAEETPVEEEPDTSVRDRLAADGSQARQAEMEARLQVRTHEERVKALTGRADSLDRAARAEREARARAERRRARLRHEARVAGAVAAGARTLLAHAEASLDRAEREREAARAARAERERELTTARARGRELKAALDKLTDSVHRGEVLGAEKHLRIEQLEAKALEDFGVEATALAAEYGPDQPVPPSPPADGETLPEDPGHPRNRPRPFDRSEQEKRLRTAERAYQQLGKVNPLALEEFAALEARHQFLSEQLEDLKKTRADLLQVVKEVDLRVEQVFTEAYRDTAREFEGVFTRLFPGGEGRLILTDPENMLTTGVDVEARPPGKKVKRLSLLSG